MHNARCGKGVFFMEVSLRVYRRVNNEPDFCAGISVAEDSGRNTKSYVESFVRPFLRTKPPPRQTESIPPPKMNTNDSSQTRIATEIMRPQRLQFPLEQRRKEDLSSSGSAEELKEKIAKLEAQLACLRRTGRVREPRSGFGGTIQRLRESRNFSLTQLARLSGCSKPSLSRIETQDEPNIKLRNILRLAAGLGLRPSEVFAAYERENPPPR
jgi:DNA-binding Xre family transcriptional regulator